MAVVLREGIEDRVQLFLFLGLVFPVGVHGQAERIFPLVPIGDLAAFETFVRVDVLVGLVAGLPVEVTGHAAVFFFGIKAFFHGHDGAPVFL
ncbi:hypothetical protein D9M71_827350 [compost metagenome]